MSEKEKVILREMVYNGRDNNAIPSDVLRDDFTSRDGVLFKETLGDYIFYATSNHGRFPCCYIMFDKTKLKHNPPKDTKRKNELWDVFNEVIKGPHYDITLFVVSDEKILLGWDFGHCGDYEYYNNGSSWEGKKWTSQEVYNLTLETVKKMDDYIAEIDKKIEELARNILLQLGVKKEDL